MKTKNIGMTVLLLGTLLFQTGCYMKFSFEDLAQETGTQTTVRSSEDYSDGETVVTANGYEVTGAFGEVSEKQVTTLTPGWQVDGSFYPVVTE